MSLKTNFQALATSFIQIMRSKSYTSFINGRQLIQKVLAQSVTLPIQFQERIKSSFHQIGNLVMLVYIYSLEIKCINEWDSYIIKAKKDKYFYWSVLMQMQGEEKSGEIVQLILQYYPQLINQKLKVADFDQIQFLVLLFSEFEVKTQKNVATVTKFISDFQKMRMKTINQLYTKEVVIIRMILGAISRSIHFHGNMGLLFDQTLLGPSPDHHIDSFCVVHQNYICDLEVHKIESIMKQLSRAGINYHIATFYYKISQVLASSDEFYKLKYLYGQFILPFLVKSAKASKAEKMEEIIIKIAELYVIGFLNTCKVGEMGVQCLLHDIQYIFDPKCRVRWVELAYLAAKKCDLELTVDGILLSKELGEFKVQGREIQLKGNVVWQITGRNIRRHKVYKRLQSKYNGINNNSTQCYIISSIQALFMTGDFLPLLDKIPKKSSILRQIDDIFKELKASNDRRSRISIDYVQRHGPEQFSNSVHQEDVYEYLLALMNQLQAEFKSCSLLKEWKEMFQIQLKQTIKCQSCKKQTPSVQDTYIHTISNMERVKTQSKEDLTDFTCTSCKSKKCVKNIKILLKSLIFIVHINRFSVEKGFARKQLPTSKIPRRIQGYELVGMIFHIGRNVQCGHYVYFARINGRRWAQFNDTNVTEFEIEIQQQFEREMKAQKTPYILFYKKI